MGNPKGELEGLFLNKGYSGNFFLPWIGGKIKGIWRIEWLI